MTGDLERKVDGCIQGFLASVDDGARGAILLAVAEGMDTGRIVRLFRCAPFRQDTWHLLDRCDEEIQDPLLAGSCPTLESPQRRRS